MDMENGKRTLMRSLVIPTKENTNMTRSVEKEPISGRAVTHIQENLRMMKDTEREG